jgi:hypothetical protein
LRAAASLEVQRAVVGRERLAKGGEPDEEEDGERYGELARREALREGESAGELAGHGAGAGQECSKLGHLDEPRLTLTHACCTEPTTQLCLARAAPTATTRYLRHTKKKLANATAGTLIMSDAINLSLLFFAYYYHGPYSPRALPLGSAVLFRLRLRFLLRTCFRNKENIHN